MFFKRLEGARTILAPKRNDPAPPHHLVLPFPLPPSLASAIQTLTQRLFAPALLATCPLWPPPPKNTFRVDPLLRPHRGDPDLVRRRLPHQDRRAGLQCPRPRPVVVPQTPHDGRLRWVPRTECFLHRLGLVDVSLLSSVFSGADALQLWHLLNDLLCERSAQRLPHAPVHELLWGMGVAALYVST